MKGFAQRVTIRVLVALFVAGMLLDFRLGALTLEELLNDPKMTPKRFASLFVDFEYEPHAAVQWLTVFLSDKRGDCDDYAILADYILGKKGFGTRAIHVRLVGRDAHAVCYVTESKAYLDFNNRRYFLTLTGSRPGLREIATKVADSFEGNWTSVSEFTYDYKTEKKTLGRTVVKTQPPASDVDRVSN